MFAYCENDPVNRSDIDGSDWRSVCKFGFVLMAVGIALLAAIPTGGGSLLLAGLGVSSVAATSAASAFFYTGAVATAGSILMASQSGGAWPVKKGQEGEKQAGIDPKNKTKIRINGRNRVPDEIDGSHLTEVKNTNYVSNTLQLRDYAQIASLRGLALRLIVREGTKIAKTVIKAGWEIVRSLH